MAQTVIVYVVANDAGFKKGMASAGASAKSFERSVKGMGSSITSTLKTVAGAAGITLGAAGFLKVMKDSVGAASNLHEQINKANVVFRDSGKTMEAWSKTTATAFGIAQDEALGMSSTFGNMLVPMGFARESAAQMSRSLVELAADMASFNNANPDEVLQALQSGLAGQVRPLRQYGVFLSDARIKQEAFNLGLYHGKGQLDAAAKASAIYAIILKDTRDAQGDFARTSGGLANQERILHANIRNLEAAIGQALYPTINKTVKSMNEWLSKGENQKKVTDAVKGAVSALGDTIKTLKQVFDDVWPVLKTVVDAMGGWKTVLEGLIALKVVSMVSGWATAFGSLSGNAGKANANVGGLSGKLAALARMSPLKIAIAAVLVGAEWKIISALFKEAGIDAGPDISKGAAAEGKKGQIITDSQGHSFLVTGGQGAKSVFLPVSSAKPVQPARARGMAPTHQTEGLKGYPAVDIMASPHTRVLAPDDGQIVRISGHDPAEGPKGDIYGWSLYYQTAGAMYFLTHLEWTAPVGSYKAGAVIALVADWGGRSHVHVGVNKGGGTVQVSKGYTPAASVATGGTAPSLTGKTATPATKASAKKPPPEVETWVGNLVSFAQGLEGVADRAAKAIAAAKKKQAEIVAASKTGLGDMQSGLGDFLRGLFPAAALTPAQIGPLEQKMEGTVARMKQIWAKLSTGTVSPAERTRLQNQLANLNNTYQSGLASLEATITQARDNLGSAIDNLSTIGVDAFEKQTNQALDGMRKSFQAQMRAFQRETERGLEDIRSRFAALTPAEQALQSLRSQHDAEQAAREMADAQKQLVDALASGDPERVRRAQETIADIQYRAREAALEKQAQQERAARDKQMEDALQSYQDQRDAQQQALEEQETDRETKYQEQRAKEEKNFQEQLAALGVALGNNTLSWEGYQKGVLALFESYKVPFVNTGANMAVAVIQGTYSKFKDAFEAGQQIYRFYQAGASGQGMPDIPNMPGFVDVNLPKTGSSAGGFNPYAPQNRGLATGGIVMNEMFTRIGERGPEAVIPLAEYKRLLGVGPGGQPAIVHIHVEGFLGSQDQLTDAVRRGMADYARRNSGVAMPGVAA